MGFTNNDKRYEGGVKMFKRKIIEKLEYENDVLKTENEIIEEKLKEKNEIILEIYRLINTHKRQKIYGEAGYREIFRQVNEIVEENVQKKLSDEIFEHYTSNSN